jgi:Domain of unknown function (DUF4259)
MGAWGYNSFENDDASDWALELEETSDLASVASALEEVIENQGLVEAPEAARAIAAAEVISALNGHPSETLPPNIVSWANGKPQPSATLVDAAKRALDLIFTDSELRELWEESSQLAEWQTSLDGLRRRLS